jgi:hypothetical protein
MLTDLDKLLMFDDCIEHLEQLNEAYDEQSKIISEMSKAIWQANEALDKAKSALLGFIEIPDDENPRKQHKKRSA